MTVTLPKAQLNSLHGADGSATYTHDGYTILGSVNGPIEVLRRDEIPEEAAIEVIVRPSAGVGSPKERHLETTLHSLLRSVILVRKLPRTLIQFTLQVICLPEESAESLKPTASSPPLPLLPHLIQTTLLSLLSSSLPLRTTFTSTLISTNPSTSPTVSPNPAQIASARALHVFAFSTTGKCLLSQSSGTFSLADYDAAYTAGQEACQAMLQRPEDGAMDTESGDGQQQGWLRGLAQETAEREQRWRTIDDA